MPDGNFGGDGSVRWEVKVDEDERSNHVNKSQLVQTDTGCVASGVEKKYGSHFILTLKVPGVTDDKSFFEFLTKSGDLDVRDDTVTFKLKIEKTPRQISVHWNGGSDKK